MLPSSSTMGTSEHTEHSAKPARSPLTLDTKASYNPPASSNGSNQKSSAEPQEPYEDWHHLLSHLRRQRSRRHRTRHRARRPRPRDPLHPLLAALPPHRPRS